MTECELHVPLHVLFMANGMSWIWVVYVCMYSCVRIDYISYMGEFYCMSLIINCRYRFVTYPKI